MAAGHKQLVLQNIQAARLIRQSISDHAHEACLIRLATPGHDLQSTIADMIRRLCEPRSRPAAHAGARSHKATHLGRNEEFHSGEGTQRSLYLVYIHIYRGLYYGSALMRGRSPAPPPSKLQQRRDSYETRSPLLKRRMCSRVKAPALAALPLAVVGPQNQCLWPRPEYVEVQGRVVELSSGIELAVQREGRPSQDAHM